MLFIEGLFYSSSFSFFCVRCYLRVWLFIAKIGEWRNLN